MRPSIPPLPRSGVIREMGASGCAARRPASPLFSDRERAVLALTDAITLISDGHVPHAVWDEAAALFGEDELAQLLWAITAMNAWNRIAIPDAKWSLRMNDPRTTDP